jgi:cytidylate kinase
MPELFSEEFESPPQSAGESPLHGYRGAVESDFGAGMPAGLTIAISREAGSRGGTIARRAGEKLGWEVYSQEMLEYGAPNAALRQDLLDRLPPAAHGWIEEHLQQLRNDAAIRHQPSILEMAQLVLALAAQGNVILLGRGAGFLLPRRSTLHLRFVAPLADRVAYMSQWLRLTDEEAAEQVRKRDHRRTEYLATHFHRKPNDVHLFDMVLNTSLLGEERCADLVAAAAKAKMSAIVGMD